MKEYLVEKNAFFSNHDTPCRISHGDLVGVHFHGLEYPCRRRVIAVPGDHVIVTRHSLLVSGALYPFYAERFDHHKKKLSVYPCGVYTQTIGYWVISENKSDLLDSRYWGPISRKHILYTIQKDQKN
jgi:type IV secretory pathway protease TraF